MDLRALFLQFFCDRCLHVQASAKEGEFDMVTASNDGLIKVWRLRRKGGEDFEAECVCSKDTGCRITCMVVHRVPEVQQPGKKKEEGGAEVEEEAEAAGDKKRKKRKRKSQTDAKVVVVAD